ncbi:MAG: M24 family metallopeptidase [Phycisphaerae bacterium]
MAKSNGNHNAPAGKKARVARYLKAAGLEALVLTRPENVSWYTDGACAATSPTDWPGRVCLIVSADAATALCANTHADSLREEKLSGSGIEVLEYPWFDDATREDMLRQTLKGRSFAADVPGMAGAERLIGAEFQAMRMQMDEAELQRYGTLCSELTAAVEAVCTMVEPLQREEELAGLIDVMCKQNSIRPWEVFVAADERMDRYPRASWTDKPVRSQFSVLVVAQREGLFAATGRVVTFGKPSRQLQARYEAMQNVLGCLIDGSRPGQGLTDILGGCAQVAEEGGLGKPWQAAPQGGITGYRSMEVPAGPEAKVQLAPGNVLAWTPTAGGTMLGETVAADADGGLLLGNATDWPVCKIQAAGRTLRIPEILVR